MRGATMVGASERAITAGNNQVGPMMSSLVNEKYTPPTAANASSACQRGSGLSTWARALAMIAIEPLNLPKTACPESSPIAPLSSPTLPHPTYPVQAALGRAAPAVGHAGSAMDGVWPPAGGRVAGGGAKRPSLNFSRFVAGRSGPG